MSILDFAASPAPQPNATVAPTPQPGPQPTPAAKAKPNSGILKFAGAHAAAPKEETKPATSSVGEGVTRFAGGIGSTPPKRFGFQGAADSMAPLVGATGAALGWAADTPVAHALDAVTGSTQRMVGGPLAGQNPLHAVTHPSEQLARDTAGEKRLAGFADTLTRTNIPSTIESAIQGNPLLKAVQDFGFETATDPATYLPGADALTIGRRAAKLTGLAKAAEAVGRTTAGKAVKGAIVEGSELRQSVNRSGEDIVKGREIRSDNFIRRHNITDPTQMAAIHNRTRKAILQDLGIPDADQLASVQNLQKKVEASAKAISEREGKAKAAAEAYRERVLKSAQKRVDDLYAKVPRGDMYEKKLADMQAQKIMAEAKLKAEQGVKTISQASEQRFMPARTAHLNMEMQHTLAQAAYERSVEAGAAKRAQHLKSDAEMVTHRGVEMPKTLQERLYAMHAPLKGWQEAWQATGAAISDVQRDMMFINPIPHIGNISILQLLGPGGVKALVRGLGYSLSDQSRLTKKIEELESVAGTQHYIGDAERPLGNLSKFSNQALERFEQGQRLALYDALKAKNLKGFEIGGQLRDALGDYRNQAPAVEFMRRWMGANFPGWRLGVVPRAMTKAARERPAGLRYYARGERIAGDDITAPLFKATTHQGKNKVKVGTDFDPGKPPDDYLKMLVNPVAYGLSPSTAGPIIDLLKVGQGAAKGDPFTPAAATARRFLGPLTIPLDAMGVGQPYGETGPPGVNAALDVTGGYLTKRKTATQEHQREHAYANAFKKLLKHLGGGE